MSASKHYHARLQRVLRLKQDLHVKQVKIVEVTDTRVAVLARLPLYCQRISFFPDVPEHLATTDIYLPLK